MKKLTVFGLGLVMAAGSASANCRSELYGEWSISHTSESLYAAATREGIAMTWRFTRDGKATVDMPPLLNATRDFECRGNKIVINKSVPTILQVVQLSHDKLVWKEEGSDKYFHFSRRR